MIAPQLPRGPHGGCHATTRTAPARKPSDRPCLHLPSIFNPAEIFTGREQAVSHGAGSLPLPERGRLQVWGDGVLRGDPRAMKYTPCLAWDPRPQPSWCQHSSSPPWDPDHRQARAAGARWEWRAGARQGGSLGTPCRGGLTLTSCSASSAKPFNHRLWPAQRLLTSRQMRQAGHLVVCPP